MGLYEYAFCSIFFIQVLNFITGQLIPQEELKNVTSCGLPIDVTCGSNEIIAVHSLYFWYHATCSGTCCNYDSSHFSAGADSGVIQAVRRKCSGENACSLVHLDGNRDFGSVGVHDPSYFVVKYYCILASRITSICSGETLTSAGEPVYLINDNYPSVTTGNSTCACSIEVFSCTSSINLYILDADLYLDETTCDQTIDFVDGTNTSLSVINCKSYYDNRIDENRFNTNYLKIDFIDNSEHNQEGYIFLGFGVSETVAFKLSCPYEQQYVCRDCGVPGPISHGKLELVDSSNSSYGSLAKVSCDNGYESEDSTVSCLDTGQWESVACLLKDCGTPYDISNGTITPVINGSATFGARANVICDEGYEIKGNCAGTQFQCGDGSCIDNSLWCDNFPSCDDMLDELLCDSGTTAAEANTGTISCLVIGKWEIVKCSAKDCGAPVNVTGATVTTSSNNLESSVATYICGEGYTHISGDLQRTCRSDSTWSGSLPTCIPDCGNPPNIPYGSITLLEDGNTTYNSTARVTCQEGYKAKKQMVTCKERGRWESSSCEPKEDTHDDKQQTEDGNASSTILVAVLVPIIVIGIILAICVIWRYRQRLCEIISSKGHESISFKNEEVLQDPNVSSKNEDILPEIPEVQPCQDSKTDVQTNEIVPETQKCQESNVAVKTDEVLSEKQQCQESNVAVKTDEDLPEKQQFQESNVAVKTEDVLPEKQQRQESNVAVKTDEVLPEKDPNVDAMTENVLHEKQQGQDSDVSAPNDELPDNQQSQVSNVAGDSEEKEKPDQS
ncbi:uncharacterized protein LOC123551041 isoform X2 [Mercenaria mercenaria]|uniref:uncharacterized protein LOC123551041 isoform X2 n=1 Tax=Mercenaria mercenaria TaxID=6596 RepID=UPI00234FB28A|nr:uncharacterized protein LOC123551041 isoform X2 [Mercenaria mercenaria]